MNLCESCRFRDADRHLIREGDHFIYCEREGGFVEPREHCAYYKVRA